MSEFQTGTNTCGDSNNVLQRAAQLNARDIRIGVDPKAGIAEFLLYRARKLLVSRRDSDGRRIAVCCF